MIATLSGKVLYKNVDRTVVDVAGVGYELIVSTDTISRMVEIGEEAFFFVHTNVREDAITLYGFLEEQEKELFLILKTVSGIGPKLALAMLSGLRVPQLCQAIVTGDIKLLTTLQGVGKRTGERLCVELKEKVAHLGHGRGEVAAGGAAPLVNSMVVDAVSALSNLGYADSVARDALAAVKKQFGGEQFENLPVETLIREALRILA